MELAVIIQTPLQEIQIPDRQPPESEQSTTALRALGCAALILGGTAAIVGGFRYRPDILWTVGEIGYAASIELLMAHAPYFWQSRERTIRVGAALGITGLLGTAAGLLYNFPGGRVFRYVGGAMALFVAPSVGGGLLRHIQRPLC